MAGLLLRGMSITTPYSGVWPVAPTPFTEDSEIDTEGMTRILDCMIDQGVDGICILANFSEQFLLSDEERDCLTRLSLEHVSERVPVIVTASHFATDIVVARTKQAAELGAAMVMLMPPYHGALLRGTHDQIAEQFTAAGEVGIPIMVQDAPLSGMDLPVDLLVRMAREIEAVKCFKIECAQAANKLRALIVAGGDAIEGPFDGEEGITLLADLDAGHGPGKVGTSAHRTCPLVTPHTPGGILRAGLLTDGAAASTFVR
mgnify:CR=1 FL=1